MEPAYASHPEPARPPCLTDTSLPPAEAHDHLAAILRQRSVHAVFQPILGLNSNTYIGFEGLIRGPADGPLQSPVSLFRAAGQSGLSLEIEMLCRQAVLEAFAHLQLPGRLFLNVSPSVLTHPSFKNGQTLALMHRLGIGPSQVTIEITENQPTDDIQAMRDALLHYRGMGFRIALDDLGEGFSSLRLWSELHPEYVKIDRHFIQGVDGDPLKRQFLRSFQQIAAGSGSQIIAEGIENEAELRTIRNIGVALGQGYFIARPAALPAHAPQPDSAASRQADAPAASARITSARGLLTYIEPVTPATSNGRVFLRFSEDPELHCLPVVHNGRPLGLIQRPCFMECFADSGRRAWLDTEPCKHAMNISPLKLDINTPLLEISARLTETRQATGDFFLTDDGYYLGIGRWPDLLRAITGMQTAASAS